MKRNAFDYLEYSFGKIFSHQFTNIVGSSLILSVGLTMILPLWISLIVYVIGSMGISTPSLLIVSLLSVVLLALVIGYLGWLSIVVPIRSIDPTIGCDIRGDFILFRTHISRYIAWTLWHGGVFLGFLVVICLLGVLTVALLWERAPLWSILSVIPLGGAYLALWFWLRFSWYHMLSEGSNSWGVYWSSRSLISGRYIRVVTTIIIYTSIVIFTTFSLSGMLSWGWLTSDLSAPLDRFAGIIVGQSDISGEIFTPLSLILFIGSWLGFSLIPLSLSILSTAMDHIFYVRYYVDLRAEREREGAFLERSGLIQSSTEE